MEGFLQQLDQNPIYWVVVAASVFLLAFLVRKVVAGLTGKKAGSAPAEKSGGEQTQDD